MELYNVILIDRVMQVGNSFIHIIWRINMELIEFKSNCFIQYNWCGKFESPSPEWMHLTRDLIDFELIVVTSGTLYIANSEREYTVRSGEYLIMHPGKFQHGYKQCDCSFYWLHFFVPFDQFTLINSANIDFKKDNLISLLSQNSITLPDRIIVLMKQLQDSDKRYHNPHLNNALTAAIIHELYSQGTEYKKYKAQNRSTQVYNDITDYIIYHACENVRVSEIADYFGYNEKYLSTLFRKQSGISLKQFILQSKMDVAKAELTDTNLSISQIAYNVGFNDTHNFTNSFKRVTGLTPSSYRESYSKRALYHQ